MCTLSSFLNAYFAICCVQHFLGNSSICCNQNVVLKYFWFEGSSVRIRIDSCCCGRVKVSSRL